MVRTLELDLIPSLAKTRNQGKDSVRTMETLLRSHLSSPKKQKEVALIVSLVFSYLGDKRLRKNNQAGQQLYSGHRRYYLTGTRGPNYKEGHRCWCCCIIVFSSHIRTNLLKLFNRITKGTIGTQRFILGHLF